MASPHSPYPGPGPSSYYQPSPPPHVYPNPHTPAPVPSPNPYQYPAYQQPPQRGRGYGRGYNNHHHHHHNSHSPAHNHNYAPMPHYPSPLPAPHPQHVQYSKYYQPPPPQEGKYPYPPYSYPYSPGTSNGAYSPSLANANPYPATAGYNAPPSGNYSPAQYEGYSPVPAPAQQQQPYSPIPAHATQYSASSSGSYPSYPSSSFTPSPNASAFTPSSSLTPSAPPFTPSPNTSFSPSSNAPSFTPSSNFTPSPNAPSFTPSSFTPSPNAPVFTPSPTAEPYTPSGYSNGSASGWQQRLSPLPKQVIQQHEQELEYEQEPEQEIVDSGEVVYSSSTSVSIQKVEEAVEVEVQEEIKEVVEVQVEVTPPPPQAKELRFHSGSPLHSPLLDVRELPKQHVEVKQQPPVVSLPPVEDTKPPPPSALPAKKYTYTGSISTPSAVSSNPGPASKADDGPEQTWVIWSRHPRNPTDAPGIIFSPKAQPPDYIVRGAVRVPTPVEEVVEPVEKEEVEEKNIEEPKPDEKEEKEEKKEIEEKKQPEEKETVKGEEGESTTGPSSADEHADTPATTVPGSPLSPTTSISKEKEKVAEKEKEKEVPAAEPTPPTSEAGTSTPKPAAPPVKKSWASLLRPATTTTPGAAPASKNALPTSSVVGFSIPAATPAPVSPGKKAELIQLLTVGPGEPKELARIRPRGLVNQGNMCFANTVLQVLVYCPPFVRLFEELGRALGVKEKEKEKKGRDGEREKGRDGEREKGRDGEREKEKVMGARDTPLVDATIEFLREFVEKEEAEVVSAGMGGGRKNGKGKEREREKEDVWFGDSFIPTSVYEAMKEKKRFDGMGGGQQEDAEEFFGFYLETLEEELLAILHTLQPPAKGKAVEEKEEAAPPEEDGWLEVGKKNRMVVTRTIKAVESPITRIFGGKSRITLRVPQKKDSANVEYWRSLRLDIQKDSIHTIDDALAHTSHPQPVQLNTQPGVTIEGSQQALIESLPSVLVLHLKRFTFDPAVGEVVKVSKRVHFGPELVIRPDVMVSTNKRITRYKLFGVLYHHGSSASGGHYTLDVLHPNRNPGATPPEGWVRIDDVLVSDVRPKDVFDVYEGDDRCAYLLFYRRVR